MNCPICDAPGPEITVHGSEDSDHFQCGKHGRFSLVKSQREPFKKLNGHSREVALERAKERAKRDGTGAPVIDAFDMHGGRDDA